MIDWSDTNPLKEARRHKSEGHGFKSWSCNFFGKNDYQDAELAKIMYKCECELYNASLAEVADEPKI